MDCAHSFSILFDVNTHTQQHRAFASRIRPLTLPKPDPRASLSNDSTPTGPEQISSFLGVKSAQRIPGSATRWQQPPQVTSLLTFAFRPMPPATLSLHPSGPPPPKPIHPHCPGYVSPKPWAGSFVCRWDEECLQPIKKLTRASLTQVKATISGGSQHTLLLSTFNKTHKPGDHITLSLELRNDIRAHGFIPSASTYSYATHARCQDKNVSGAIQRHHFEPEPCWQWLPSRSKERSRTHREASLRTQQHRSSSIP